MGYRPGQKVRLLAFAGPRFKHDWSEKATICKRRIEEVDPTGRISEANGWYIVRSADTGSKTNLHATRIMADTSS